jgi:Protein of unknown function (DUF3341)
MNGPKAIVGVFSYLDDVLKAVASAKASKLDYRVYSPTLRHEIEEATFPEKSPVRRFTLIGGATGCTFGFALAILCSLDWPIRVSAKDIVSPPGFFVIGYECTILFGALATLAAILLLCGLPNILRKVGYDPRFTYDKFGVVVGCEANQIDEVKKKLLDAGADEVQVRDGL